MGRRYHRPDYAMLRAIVQRAISACDWCSGPVRVDGKFESLGDGLNHKNHLFFIEGDQLPKELSERPYVLRLLKNQHDIPDLSDNSERLQREALTLKVLASLDTTFRSPEFVGFVFEGSRPIGMIETGVAGISMGNSGFKDAETIGTIANIAAEIHRLPAERFSHLESCSTRSEHALDWLRRLDAQLFDAFPCAAEARNWIEDYRPYDDCACVLHGDLLPQNLVFDLKFAMDTCTNRIGVVDWEYARIGDPAYDVAIVTRGGRKLLGVAGGTDILLDAYHDANGPTIRRSDVFVYELLLVLGWLESSMRRSHDDSRRGHAPEFFDQQLRSLLRRAQSSRVR